MSNEEALSSYIEKVGEAGDLIELIAVKANAADLAEVLPEQIHWGHVGSAAHLVSQLQEVVDRLYGLGEYAE